MRYQGPEHRYPANRRGSAPRGTFSCASQGTTSHQTQSLWIAQGGHDPA